MRFLPWTTCKYEILIRTKVDNHIEFPVNGLDMSSYVMQVQSGTRQASAGSALYDLAAVIVHHGSGTGSGHYTALATNNQVKKHEIFFEIVKDFYNDFKL